MINLDEFTKYMIRKEGGDKPGTIGYKMNNPGNLRFAGQPNAEPDASGFAKFTDMESGIEAFKRQIALDASRGHTLRSFISKYAPPSENDTETYIRQMSQWTGLKPDDVLQEVIDLGPTNAGEPQSGSKPAGQLYPSWEETKASLPKDIPDPAYDAIREKYFNTYIRPQVLKEGSNVTATHEEFLRRTARADRSEWPRASLLGASALSGLAEAPLGLLAKEGLVKDSPLQKVAEGLYGWVKGLRESTAREAERQEIPGAGLIGFAGELAGNLPYFAGAVGAARAGAMGLARLGIGGAGQAAAKGAGEMAAKFSAGEIAAGAAKALGKGEALTPELINLANKDALNILLNRAKMLKIDLQSIAPLVERAGAGDLQPLAARIGAETAMKEKAGELVKFIIPEAIGLVQGAYDAGRAEPGKEVEAATTGFILGTGTAAAFEAAGPLYRLLKGRLNVSDETAQALADTAVGTATPEQAEVAAKAAFQDPRVAREIKWVVENRVRVLKALGNPKIPDSAVTGGPLKVTMRGADGQEYSFQIKDASKSSGVVGRMWRHFNRGGELLSVEGTEQDITLLRSRLDDQLKAAGAYDLPVVLRNEAPEDALREPKLLLPHIEETKPPTPEAPKVRKKAAPPVSTPAEAVETEVVRPVEDLKTVVGKGVEPPAAPQPAESTASKVFREAKIVEAQVLDYDGQKVPFVDFRAGDYVGNASVSADRKNILIQLDGSDEIIRAPLTVRDKNLRDVEYSITDALSKRFGAPRRVMPKDVPIFDKLERLPSGMYRNIETGKIYPSKTMALHDAGVLTPNERLAVGEPFGEIAQRYIGAVEETAGGELGSSLGSKSRPFWDRTVTSTQEELPNFAAISYSQPGKKPYLEAKKEFLTPSIITHEALHAELGTLGLHGYAAEVLSRNPMFMDFFKSFNKATRRLYRKSPAKLEEVLAYLTQSIRHENRNPDAKALLEHFINRDTSREKLFSDVAEVYRLLFAKSRLLGVDSPQLRRFQRSATDMLWRTGGMGDFVQNVEKSGDIIHYSDGQWHLYNSRRDVWTHFDDRESLTTHLLENYSEPLSTPELVDVSDFGELASAALGDPFKKPTRRGILGTLVGGLTKAKVGTTTPGAAEARITALTKALSQSQTGAKNFENLKTLIEESLDEAGISDAPWKILGRMGKFLHLRSGELDIWRPVTGLGQLVNFGANTETTTLGFMEALKAAKGISNAPTKKSILAKLARELDEMDPLTAFDEINHPDPVINAENWKQLKAIFPKRGETLEKASNMPMDFWDYLPEGTSVKEIRQHPEWMEQVRKKMDEYEMKELRAGTVTPGMELQRTPLPLGESGESGILQRFAVNNPFASGPKGPKVPPSTKGVLPPELQPPQPINESFSQASFWITPFYDWLARVSKKNNWPELYNAFDKIKQASLQMDVELGKWIREIKKTGLLRVPYEKRVDLAEFLRTPENQRPSFIAQHHLTPEDVTMAEKIRELYDRGYTATEVKAPYLENYIFRLREPNFKIDSIRPTSRYTKADIDFAADHHRTKEIDLTDRDVLSNLYNYLRLGLRRKYLKESVKDALALVNAQNPDGTFVLGNLQPYLRRHIDLMLSRPDRSAVAIRRTFSSMIETINTLIGNINKRTGLKIEPLKIGEDPTQRFLLYSYAGTLGLRPMVPIRDSMQLFLTTYPLLGSKYLARGFQRAFPGIRHFGEGSVWDEAERAGALMVENPIHNIIAGTSQTIESSRMGRAAEWMLKPLMISNNSNRLIAYYGHKEKALDALTDFAIHRDLKKLAKRSGIVFLDEPLTQRFLREATNLTPSQWENWAQRVAKEMVDISQWNYHRGASPGMYKWAVGRMFGQYGTWPMNYVSFIRRLLTRGDPSDRAIAVGRLMAAHSATLLAGAEAGIDTGQWVFTNPGAYSGGPITQFVLEVPQALDFETFKGEEARRDLKRFPTLFIPGAMTAQRLWSAANTGPEDTFKLLMGFNPMKKGEEERGFHQFLPSEE